MDVIVTSEDEALGALGAYLARHGLDPALARGDLGARYLARRAAGTGRTPSEVFESWFSTLLDAAPGEAESQGWIAFLVSGAGPEMLLRDLSADAQAAIASRMPQPPIEAPLAMPVQQLARRRSRAAAAQDLVAPRTAA